MIRNIQCPETGHDCTSGCKRGDCRKEKSSNFSASRAAETKRVAAEEERQRILNEMMKIAEVRSGTNRLSRTTIARTVKANREFNRLMADPEVREEAVRRIWNRRRS